MLRGGRAVSIMSTGSWAQIAAKAGPATASHSIRSAGTTAGESKAPSTVQPVSDASPMTHRGRSSQDPLVVSLRFNKKLFDDLTNIRQKHFPPENNNLAAHLTILHALPAECLTDMQHYLDEITSGQKTFRLSLGKVQVKPRIILLPVRGQGLNEIVHQIQQTFWEMLSDQDRSTFRQGHITLCNKRSEEEIAERGSQIQHELDGCERWHCAALGIDLWVYQGKRPWKHVSFHQFQAA